MQELRGYSIKTKSLCPITGFYAFAFSLVLMTHTAGALEIVWKPKSLPIVAVVTVAYNIILVGVISFYSLTAVKLLKFSKKMLEKEKDSTAVKQVTDHLECLIICR